MSESAGNNRLGTGDPPLPVSPPVAPPLHVAAVRGSDAGYLEDLVVVAGNELIDPVGVFLLRLFVPIDNRAPKIVRSRCAD